MAYMKYILLALFLYTSAGHANDVTFTLGAGKALNNTNRDVPGYLLSGHMAYQYGSYSYEAAYTRMGISYLAKNTTIKTLGVNKINGKFQYGISWIVAATYSPSVWWNLHRPTESCVIGQDDCQEYPNDGTHFTRECQRCGAVLDAEYKLLGNFGIRAEYYGLRHMTPTYQGAVIQFTYTL